MKTAEKIDDKKRMAEILKRLKKDRPLAACELTHDTPFQLLVAVILSAQCTDERVNKVIPGLFKKYATPKAVAKAQIGDLENAIRSTGFFRNKAKNIKGAAEKIEREFGGRVPRTMEELITLPGVARKTANVVLGTAFGVAEGVVVDTHVSRVAMRLGFAKDRDPKKTEQILMSLMPKAEWVVGGHRILLHGRYVCKAKSPDCARCALSYLCPSAFRA